MAARPTTESTIQEVLGCPPFSGSSKFHYFRSTTKSWLMRQGWSSTALGNITPDELRRCYINFNFVNEMAKKYQQPEIVQERALRAASSAYAPKNAAVILRIQQLKGTGTGQAAPSAPPIMSQEDAEAISEARIVEMVREQVLKQKPVETIVKVMDGAKITAVKGVAHPKLPAIAKAMASRMNNGFHPHIWIGGQTGAGKSHIVEQIAEAMKLKFYSHGAMSMSHELLGYQDANGRYHRTPFRDCWEKGGVCLLDECDSWDAAVTLALNFIAGQQGTFPDGMVMRHKDCILVAAGNTFGAGATSEFVGRNKLDVAFMSRFAVKFQLERDPRIELAIAGGNTAWVKRVTEARARAAAAGIKHLIDPRHSQAGAALIAAGMTMDEAAECTYLAGLPEAQRRTIEGN